MNVVTDVEFKISTMLQKGLVTAGTAGAALLATQIAKHFGVQMDVGQQAAVAIAVTGILGSLRNLLKQKVSWLGWL